MTTPRRPTRRAVLGAAAIALVPLPLAGCTAPQEGLLVHNPLVRQRADPHVSRDDAGRYLLTGSVPEYDRIVLRRSATLDGLRDADEVTLWRRPASGSMAGYIWAPELHRIDGRWFVYFAAGDGDDPFRIRMYVLAADGDDPMAASWSVRDRIRTQFDTFALDATTFTHRDRRYLVWAQSEPGIDTNSNLYISAMSEPTTLTGRQTRIAVPTADWEIRGFKVNEGPAVLVRNGRVFITFSASATDSRYCMGLLTADQDADLLDPASWTKSPAPVFQSDEAAGQWGPGHNCFTTAAGPGSESIDLLVYHARPYREITGDPLFDPNRHARAQLLRWSSDGTPVFGSPVPDGPLPLTNRLQQAAPRRTRKAIVRPL